MVACVAHRTGGQVLLMLGLSQVELGTVGHRDRSRDTPVACAEQVGLEGASEGGGNHELLGRSAPDGRAILGADIVALAHSLSRVVIFQEDGEDSFS